METINHSITVMCGEFNFNARQFFDFSRTEDTEIDESYFDKNHEYDSKPIGETTKSESKDALDTKTYEEFVSYIPLNEHDARQRGQMRRSMSLDHLNCIGKEGLSEHYEKTASTSLLNKSEDRRKTRPTKLLSKEKLNLLAQPKKQFHSQEDLPTNKYTTFAEAIKNYQKRTPERFRTKPVFSPSPSRIIKPPLLNLGRMTSQKLKILGTPNSERRPAIKPTTDTNCYIQKALEVPIAKSKPFTTPEPPNSRRKSTKSISMIRTPNRSETSKKTIRIRFTPPKFCKELKEENQHPNKKKCDQNCWTFKARPATVLKAKPFEPKKDSHRTVEVKEFHLATDSRAKKRQEYDIKIRKKENVTLKKKVQGQRLFQTEKEEWTKLGS